MSSEIEKDKMPMTHVAGNQNDFGEKNDSNLLPW